MKPHETGTDNPIDFPKQMNANELAKYLYRLNGYMDTPKDIVDITHPAADMLIKQQLEIEALKKQNADMNRRLLGWDIYEQ